MMLTQETPTAPQTARRRTDWAKLFWMMKSSPLTLVGGVIIVLILLLMVLSLVGATGFMFLNTSSELAPEEDQGALFAILNGPRYGEVLAGTGAKTGK